MFGSCDLGTVRAVSVLIHMESEASAVHKSFLSYGDKLWKFWHIVFTRVWV
jgi:hypothetical protein